MRLAFSLRLVRFVLHVAEGLLVCALLFPFLGPARRAAHVQRWSRQLMHICQVRVELRSDAAPLAHALIVANHISWLDIFVINAALPCRFVAKAEVRHWPLLGWLAARAGTIFIERANGRDLRATMLHIAQLLRDGERVGYFPEGTSSGQGQLLPFHAGLFEAALAAAAPVQPAALSYVELDGERAPRAEYIGAMRFVDSVAQILGGAPMLARLETLAPIASLGMQRRSLAAAAEAAVAHTLDVAWQRPARCEECEGTHRHG